MQTDPALEREAPVLHLDLMYIPRPRVSLPKQMDSSAAQGENRALRNSCLSPLPARENRQTEEREGAPYYKYAPATQTQLMPDVPSSDIINMITLLLHVR